MSDSFIKSNHFTFSNCKLSPLFKSNYSIGNDQRINLSDYVDLKLIQSGYMLNKIAKIDNCPLELDFQEYSDRHTPQNKNNLNNTYEACQNSSTLDKMRDNPSYLGNFNSTFTKHDNNLKIRSSLYLMNPNKMGEFTKPETKMTIPSDDNEKIIHNNFNSSRNYSDFNKPIINSSIMRKNQSAFTENKTNLPNPLNQKMNVTIINNNSYTFNNYPTQDPFICRKRPRGEPKSTMDDEGLVDQLQMRRGMYNGQNRNSWNNHNLSAEKNDEGNMEGKIIINGNHTANELGLVEENVIEVNKVTKRLFEDRFQNGDLHRLHKLRKYRKDKNIKLKFEENRDKDVSIHYAYLLDKFSDSPDDYCSFDNEALKNRYMHYFTYGRSNEAKITFGDNPLNIFQNYHSWYLQEVNKEASSKSQNSMAETILNKMKELTTCMSQLPILLGPQFSQHVIKMPVFKKKLVRLKPEEPERVRERERENGDKKIFQCSLCDESFHTGQGLGGHMSRKHQNKSEKFQKKKEVRKNREPMRLLLVEAKRRLCDRYSIDYDEQMKTKAGKFLVKRIILEHREEFKEFRMEAKKRQFGIVRDQTRK